MEKNYIALEEIVFGHDRIAPGQPVPVEAGRDYASMERLGQIREVGVVAPQQDASSSATPRR